MRFHITSDLFSICSNYITLNVNCDDFFFQCRDAFASSGDTDTGSVLFAGQSSANHRPAGDTREYVRPMKISPLGLNEEDMLYASDHGETEPVQLRHHSGHFRHRTANIWDPHPVYEFTAFQRNFHLVLEHDSGFASPDLKVPSGEFSRDASNLGRLNRTGNRFRWPTYGTTVRLGGCPASNRTVAFTRATSKAIRRLRSRSVSATEWWVCIFDNGNASVPDC